MDTARTIAAELSRLLRRERDAAADFLLALADFDRRRLWRDLGYASLFHFLHRELGMSKGAAHYRKTAAELVQRVPAVGDALREGSLCITSVIELAKVLTPENQGEVLPRFFHCSRQEAKAVSAELAPAEVVPVRTVALAVPVPRTTESSTPPVHGVQPVEPLARAEADAAPLLALAPASAPRTVSEPLNAELRRLHVTVSRRFLAKLAAARDALAHSHPGADEEAILEAGLDLVIERAAKRRGLVDRPRPAGAEPRKGRAIPAAMKREVWARDWGRCQWRMDNGEPCGETHRLEFDHVTPVALGGESTPGNLRLVCAAHNRLAARRIFGDALMDRYASG